MDLESFTIAVLCLLEDLLAELRADPAWRRVRQRGPAPTLADSEVLTMEVVGEFLGWTRMGHLSAIFAGSIPTGFPPCARVHRTTFARQAANLWVVKEQVWDGCWIACCTIRPSPSSTPCPLRSAASAGPTPARASGGRPPSAAIPAAKPPSTAFATTCASAGRGGGRRQRRSGQRPRPDLVPELVEGAIGQVIGDRNYWDPR